ncbi:Protein maternal effect lethal 26, partial [Trichuris trichiura]
KTSNGFVADETVTSNSSYTEIRVKRVKHQWTVKNFSHCHQEYLESFISLPHEDTIFKWSVKIYPKGNGDSNKDYVFLCLNRVPQPHGKPTKNSFKANFVMQNVLGDTIDMRVHPSPSHSDYVTYVKRDVVLPKILPQDFLAVFTTIDVVVDTVTVDAEDCSPVSSLTCKYFPTFPTDIPDSESLFISDMKALLENGAYADFSISVGGITIPAHRCILAARSNVFAAMLLHATEESRTCTLEITDFEPDVIQELVRFIYSGHCNRIDELGADLLTAADKYNLEDLKFHCEKALVRAINVRNVCELLVLADSHMAGSLYRGCMDYMRKNVNDVTDTAGWETIIRDYPELVTELVRQFDIHRAL